MSWLALKVWKNFVLLANHFEANWIFFKIIVCSNLLILYPVVTTQAELSRRTHFSCTVTRLKSDRFNWQSRIINCLLEQLISINLYFILYWQLKQRKKADCSVIIVPINPLTIRNCIWKNMAKSLRSLQIIFHFFYAFVSIHKATMYF